jgi:hypothetical protein
MKLEAWTFKFPIPREDRNKLAYIFELVTTNSEYYELSDMLLSGLTATEISLIVHFLGITEQFLYAKKYLNPLRDLDPSMALFESRKGCRIFMLGNDITDLMERIQLPATYWSGRIAKAEANGGIIPPPKIWVVSIPPGIRFSENDTMMEYKSDTHSGDRSMVLWKKKYSLPRNAVFTGRAVGDNGRDILDEVDFAFKFPFEHRPH